jgi:hypothetical protein
MTMSWLANILIWVSLAAASFASVTAYWPTLDRVAESETPLTLTAPAGASASDPTTPLVEVGPLTPEAIELLRSAREQRVQVKEFAWSRWSGRYIFLSSCVGLVVGAMLLRRSQAALAEISPQLGSDDGDHLVQVTEGLAAMIALDQSSSLTPAGLISGIERLQQGPLVAFTKTLPRVVSRLGLARYAQMMSHFAEGERILNRAWSAAVDGAVEESRDCLRHSHQALLSAIELFKS